MAKVHARSSLYPCWLLYTCRPMGTERNRFETSKIADALVQNDPISTACQIPCFLLTTQISQRGPSRKISIDLVGNHTIMTCPICQFFHQCSLESMRESGYASEVSTKGPSSFVCITRTTEDLIVYILRTLNTTVSRRYLQFRRRSCQRCIAYQQHTLTVPIDSGLFYLSC